MKINTYVQDKFIVRRHLGIATSVGALVFSLALHPYHMFGTPRYIAYTETEILATSKCTRAQACMAHEQATLLRENQTGSKESP